MIKLCDLGMKYTKKKNKGWKYKNLGDAKKASFQKGVKRDKIIKRVATQKIKRLS